MPIGFARAQESKFLPVSYVTETLPELIPEQSEGVARRFRLPGAGRHGGADYAVVDHFAISAIGCVCRPTENQAVSARRSAIRYERSTAQRKNLEEEIANMLRLKPREHHLCEASSWTKACP